MNKVDRAIKNFVIKTINAEEVILNSVKYENNRYVASYIYKYFDGGGYCWSIEKKLAITQKELTPYLIDDIILKTIIEYLKKENGSESIEIYTITGGLGIYHIKYQSKYFDGGGYRWTDVINDSIPVKSIEKILRNEKIEKIKERT